MVVGRDRAGPGSGHGRWRAVVAVVGMGALLAAVTGPPGCAPPPSPREPERAAPASHLPTLPPDHTHARALLANALRYADPTHGLTDPASGYPFEGWNQDPDAGLLLRNFTQLTAIGVWLELLANVAAGQVDAPFLSPDQALARLARVAASLRQDQGDPTLGADGLLGNFLDLSTGRRRGPLVADADREAFRAAFGPDRGPGVWRDLVAAGWIAPRPGGETAEVKLGGKDGPDPTAAPFDPATAKKVRELLDRRTVQVVFGDNANLSASAARAIGALLLPAVKDRPEAAALRRELESFLDAQAVGYARLFDPAVGLFRFGWDGQRRQWLGSAGRHGSAADHLDYLVNEFRGPALFVVLRFGLPAAPIRHMGLQLKPYRAADGRDLHVLAPWEGSAFQALGLDASMGELASPSWRALLRTAVAVEADFATRHGLPGFLSESYTGKGLEYSGDVGIPDIAVSPKPRITDAASLYSLGSAYAIDPDAVERFLAANWPAISGLFTDHGPWEGYNVTRREPIRFQTTAHTVSLVLGLLGKSSDHMARYLESHGLAVRLADVYRPGPAADLLAPAVRVSAGSPRGHAIRSERDPAGFRVAGESVGEVQIALAAPSEDGFDLSGGILSIRYRCAGAEAPAVLTLKRSVDLPPRAGVLPQEVFTRFADTAGREAEVELPLPATPGLAGVKEVWLTVGRGAQVRPLDLTLTRVRFRPTPPMEADGDVPARPAGARPP